MNANNKNNANWNGTYGCNNTIAKLNRSRCYKNDFDLPSIIIPSKLENLQLPDPTLLQYYIDDNERVVWIDAEIDQNVLEVSKRIRVWNKEDENLPVEERKPIKIFIYSYGGDGAACFSLIDMILLSKTPIWTINAGVAMSAGLLIFLAGHKRYCTKYSTALIHSGSGGVQGSFEQTESQMKDYKHFVQVMRDFILERTSIDKKLFDKKKSQEWYIYSDEQVSLNICEAIVDDINTLI